MTLLAIFLIIGFATIGYLVYRYDKHYKWFMALKVGDKVLVRIYSQYCECAREATVVAPVKDKYIEVVLSEEVKQSCIDCSNTNGANGSCWYQVTQFKKGDVAKITTRDKNYMRIL